MQQTRRSEVRGKCFVVGRGSALRRPFNSMLMRAWDEAGQGAPVDSLAKKLMPLM